MHMSTVTMVSSSKEKKKVCVIGAGVSGLASARVLLREGHDVTVLEQSGGVGGQWLYEPGPDAGDPLGRAGVHSSVYASVRLISPREVTGFSEFPFYPNTKDGGGGGDPRRYPCHGEFLRYIRDFCDAFGLMDVVRLNTKVVHVGIIGGGSCGDNKCLRWVVKCTPAGEEVFDAVVVAVGQYTQPRLPNIKDMEKWGRRQLHSHSYRVPDSFKDQVVVVVGCHESGRDIAMELCEVAREVHVSVKSMDDVAPGVSKALSRRHNLHLHPQIDCLCEDGRVVFAGDDSAIVADAVVYCTGYKHSFPFLDTAGVVAVDDDGNRVGPLLFEHTFPPALAPSLSFVGLPRKVPVPWFYEVQARWVAQVLSGRRSLPSPEEMMMRSVEEHLSSHVILDWEEYCDDFAEKHCGFPPMEEWKKELLSESLASLRDRTESFRDDYHDSDLVREGLRSQGWPACPDAMS